LTTFAYPWGIFAANEVGTMNNPSNKKGD
jgi:hypothetical protein